MSYSIKIGETVLKRLALLLKLISLTLIFCSLCAFLPGWATIDPPTIDPPTIDPPTIDPPTIDPPIIKLL